MDKIVIIGSPGAGKSTFAQALGKILDIEVLHLDRYFWSPNWKKYPRQTRITIQQELVGKDRWIIEGTYLGSSDDRLNAADTIIFLDTPWYVCLRQVFQRHFISQTSFRSDIPDGCTDRLSILSILKVLVFPYKGRNLLCRKLNQIHAREVNASKKKLILTYRSIKEKDEFLLSMAAFMAEEHNYQKSINMQEMTAAASPRQSTGFNLAKWFPQVGRLLSFHARAVPATPHSK